VKVITIYETKDGECPFKKWLKSLNDKTTIARIDTRIARVEQGNFGDFKSVGNGIMELRLDFGSGYRIYYGLDGEKVVILLIGGDKSTQRKDIRLAQVFWNDYLGRAK
jgi:putative addiction module killer protein